MDIITDAQLLERIEEFLAATKMAPSRFGVEAMGDSKLVFQLRKGERSLSLKNAARIARFMQSHTSEQAA